MIPRTGLYLCFALSVSVFGQFNTYYDPSYGLGAYTDLKGYEDAAFDGELRVLAAGALLYDLPDDNNDATDHSDEINNYVEDVYP